MKYQVKDWDVYFENDRSRTREKCSFVCVPNKQHGMGFARIMAEVDGAAIYGIWCLILGACSQQKKRAGWLTDNGERTGTAWGADDLAVKFRRPALEIQRSLDFICSDKVGWMVKHEIINDTKGENTNKTESNRQVTVKSPSSAPETNGNEGKGREGNRNEAKLGARYPLVLTKPGEETIRLISLCKEVLGEVEMTKHHKRWAERAMQNPNRLNRVISEVRVMALEKTIKTTPAKVAEDLWKRF